MSNIYCQVYIHLVFAVKYRQASIHSGIRDEVEKYISGIVRNENQKLLAIYCMPDHCHVLLSMTPDKIIADLVRIIKANSSRWMNEKKLHSTRFEWQTGYGAFSYSKSQVNDVANYILGQEQFHREISFRAEYVALLQRFNIEYDERYIFEEMA